ncbi:F-box protein [Forsythia ovata]|uniref:F-box protein n=1 Tax=Forsythia ovata TaxID=205694 RepID=A0ABD1S162_9LAMI
MGFYCNPVSSLGNLMKMLLEIATDRDTYSVYSVVCTDGFYRFGLSKKFHPETIDDFDRLLDSLFFLIFNNIGDVKVLDRCWVVLRCFQSLVLLVDNVVVLVDCIISNNSSSSSSTVAASTKSHYPVSSFLWFFFPGLFKPFHSHTQLVTPSPRHSSNAGSDQNSVLTHHSPTQLEIKRLRIELHGRELGIDDGVLIKWK